MTKEEKEALQAAVKETLQAHATEVGTVLAQIQTQIKEHGSVQDNSKQAMEKLTQNAAELTGRLKDIEQAYAEDKARNFGAAGRQEKSIGQQFVESKELLEFAPAGQSAMAGKSKRWGTKTITSIGASGGPGIFPDRVPGVQQEPLQPLSIRDLIDVGQTSTNSIEYVRENVFTNAADVVSEGTLKPESNITFELLDSPVRTIAHWIRASKQVLADFKQLASIIDGRLRYGLKLKEEQQILLGDGAGGNLLGLIPQATAYSSAYNRGGDTMIDTIRHAILQVRQAFYPATGIVMNPQSFHDLELTKNSLGNYMIANPTARTSAVLWGLPVVESDGMQSGGFLVGAFKLAATLWDREQAGILVSTEDQDNFIRNLVTILCEERLALTVFRPRAFVYGGFPAGTTT